MVETSARTQLVRRLSLLVAVVGVIAGAAMIILGLVSGFAHQLGGLAVTQTMTGAMMIAYALLFNGLVHVFLRTDGNINRMHHDLLDLIEGLQRVEPHIRTIATNSQISDAARSIAHRDLEREALRQAIREEMYSGDWETAHYLIDEMERRFGYKQEVQTLRTELAQAREMTIEEKIGEAISHIEKLFTDHRWERARVEIERLLKLFPRHERIQAMPAELSRRRDARKAELLAEWKQVVQRNEIDRGIEILTELDPFLSREEAQALQDSARDVFKARLLNLGVQFGLAVSESRWRDALEVGVQICQEFPNSRMAQEVSPKIETLRVRAGFVPHTEVVQQRKTPTG